jgi:hypothetical protein
VIETKSNPNKVSQERLEVVSQYSTALQGNNEIPHKRFIYHGSGSEPITKLNDVPIRQLKVRLT